MKTLNPNDLGKKYIVEECRKVSISNFIKATKSKLKESILKTELEYWDLNIQLGTSVTHKGGIRYWFKCPTCTKNVNEVYLHPITNKMGCRTCLNLRYKKSRFKGMVENM
jgi:hypothetical protein